MKERRVVRSRQVNLANGMIMMAGDEDAEAMHFQSVFDLETLTSTQDTDVSDLKTFEEELAALTLPDDDVPTGGAVTGPA